MNAGSFLDFFEQRRFQIIRIRIHFARCNFLVGSAHKTKFTNAQTIFRAHGRSKDATSHGPRFIKFAESRRGIERRARLVVGELGKAFFCLFAFVQPATRWITGKIFRRPGNRLPSAFAHAQSTLRRGLLQLSESFTQADGVDLIYGEHSYATLRATWTADEPLSAFTGNLSQRGIHYLDQHLIP